jgi:hypothetical protein
MDGVPICVQIFDVSQALAYLLRRTRTTGSIFKMPTSEALSLVFKADLCKTYLDANNRAGEDGYRRAEAIGRLHGNSYFRFFPLTF